MQLIGTPNEADLDFVNENARRYIRQLPRHARQSLPEKFPHVQPLAIDLVEKMLTFDPRQRITGNTFEALSIFCFYRFFKFSLFQNVVFAINSHDSTLKITSELIAPWLGLEMVVQQL
jgi:hypothetical protein